MELKICTGGTPTPPQRGRSWERSIARVVAAPPAAWCEATLLRMEAGAGLLKKHGLDGPRLSLTGYSASAAKLAALTDFEKQGSQIGVGLAMKSGYFWVVRKGGAGIVRVADTKTAKRLANCPVWPVNVSTSAGKVALDFVGTAEDSMWQILQCWSPLLYEWGIRDYYFELHGAEDAWEQLDVDAAFLHFGPDELRRFREVGVPNPKGYRPWNSRACRVVGGVLAGCETGRWPNALH